MIKSVATIRTVTLLLATTLTVTVYATDITITTMSGVSPYCGSSTVTLDYDGTGTIFAPGNIFTVQLSDPAGDFSTPALIGTLSSTARTGTIQATLPAVASGSGYRIRIVSSEPSTTGTDNGSDLTIVPAPAPSISISADPFTTVGAGSVVYFTSSTTEGGSSPVIEWNLNGDPAGNGVSYVLSSASAGDEVYATVTADVACATPPAAVSKTIAIDVDDNLTKTDNAWSARAQQVLAGNVLERSNASGFSIGGKVYVGCGSTPTDTYRKDFWEYDPVNDTWTQLAALGQPVTAAAGRYNAIGFNILGKGYIGTGKTSGGVVLKDFYEYEPANNTWTVRLNFPGAPREQAFGFGIGNKGYVGGGFAAVDFKDVFEFNPADNKWTHKADFGGGKRLGAASFSIGTKGYVAAGYSATSDTYYNDLWSFDGTTWAPLTNMPGDGRTRATAFALAGNGYVGMGFSDRGYHGDFYQYDPVSDAWTPKQYYPGPPTLTHGVGISMASANRAFVYKDGTMTEFHLLTVASFPSKICTGETISLAFDAPGFTFGANNEFTAAVSQTADFAVSLSLGSNKTSSSSGTIPGLVPITDTGTYYVKVSSSTPALTAVLEAVIITRIPTEHPVDLVGGDARCVDVPVTFTSELDGPGFQWYKNDELVGTDSKTYIDASLADGDQIKVTRTYTDGCSEAVALASIPIAMTIYSPPKPVITIEAPNKLTTAQALQYQWFNAGVPISGANTQTYQMTDAGVYKVKITDSHGCVVFSDELADAFTGLEDNLYKLEVVAYPSPFNNDMYLTVTDDILERGCDFSMSNELGQTVISKQRAQKVNKLDMSGKAPGLYILRVSFGQKTVVRRLVKIN